MHIDQKGLNYLLSAIQPKSSQDALRKKRGDLIKKLNNGVISNKGNGKAAGNKQLLMEFKSIDKQIQMAIYEEKSLKLRLERLKLEEATTANPRKKERILAEHESLLHNASMGKLLSASEKSSRLKITIGDGAVLSLSGRCPGDRGGESTQHGIKDEFAEINSDIKEAIKYGMEAAEVARRRRHNQVNEAIEEAAKKSAAKKRKRKKISINTTV